MILHRLPSRIPNKTFEDILHYTRKVPDQQVSASTLIATNWEVLRTSSLCKGLSKQGMIGTCFEQCVYDSWIKFGVPADWIHVHVDVSGSLKKQVEWDLIISPPAELGLPPALNGLKTSSRERGKAEIDRAALATRDHYKSHPLIGNRTPIIIGWFYIEYPNKQWTIAGEIRRRAMLESYLHADAKARTVLDEMALSQFIDFYANRGPRPRWFDEQQVIHPLPPRSSTALTRISSRRLPSSTYLQGRLWQT